MLKIANGRHDMTVIGYRAFIYFILSSFLSFFHSFFHSFFLVLSVCLPDGLLFTVLLKLEVLSALLKFKPFRTRSLLFQFEW